MSSKLSLYVFDEGYQYSHSVGKTISVLYYLLKQKNWCYVSFVGTIPTQSTSTSVCYLWFLDFLTAAFNKFWVANPTATHCIVIDDEIVAKVGFMWYMGHALQAMQKDSTIGAASAWNPQGMYLRSIYEITSLKTTSICSRYVLLYSFLLPPGAEAQAAKAGSPDEHQQQ